MKKKKKEQLSRYKLSILEKRQKGAYQPPFPPSERTLSIIAEIEKINPEAAEDARKTWWCVASMGCLVKDHRTHREIAEAYVRSFVEWQQLAEFGL